MESPPSTTTQPAEPRAALRRLAVLAVWLVAASACRREVDQQAKARIFSPEQPTGAQAEAAEKLDARRLAEDGPLAARVLRMGREEAAHRLGAHKVQSKVTFAWSRGPQPLAPDGGVDPASSIQSTEEASLLETAAGDFQLRLQNDHNQGFELVQAQGAVYVRGLFGPFRKRRTDRTDPARLRDQTLSAVATFDRLARGLKLRAAGAARTGGRTAVKYEVIGSGARLGPEDQRELPPPQYPEPPPGPAGQAARPPGPDPDTARRLELFEREQPIAVSGTLLIDEATSTPLAAELSGRFRVTPAAAQKGPAAELDLRVTLATTEVGGNLNVKVPAFEADPSTPHAVKDPLRFLGKVAAAAGGASTEEPVEDDEALTPEEAVEPAEIKPDAKQLQPRREP